MSGRSASMPWGWWIARHVGRNRTVLVEKADPHDLTVAFTARPRYPAAARRCFPNDDEVLLARVERLLHHGANTPTADVERPPGHFDAFVPNGHSFGRFATGTADSPAMTMRRVRGRATALGQASWNLTTPSKARSSPHRTATRLTPASAAPQQAYRPPPQNLGRCNARPSRASRPGSPASTHHVKT
jgi:hypothetical protein